MAEMPEYRVLFDELVSLPADADASSKRVRGTRFERVLNGLLNAEALQPRTSYRPLGEEVDGSFVFDNRVYLLEAKWQAAPLPASALYTFKGKVDGKLVGTVGICISMSGFSEDSADALRFGKTVNVLMFDGEEISACIRGTESFSHALRAKLRAAAEEGLAYAPRRVQHVERDLSGDVTSKTDAPERAPRSDGRTLVIVCEGPRDAVLLGGLAKRLMLHLGLTGDISVFPAIGKAPLGGLVNIARHMNPTASVMVVADGDGGVADTLRMVSARVNEPVITIVPDPTIEASWLGMTPDQFNRVNSRTVEKIVDGIALDELIRENDSFRAFVDALRKELGT